ncbi:hypothetical protein [Halalkalibacterium ligniniphilum]|uniref:hypothetical protein n=1 Tax=Halalkalibacterium ligniniphilum TaxID=1134413 RepID=UPI0003788D40|nr:hypothetical protein [Halalkalibacterium ligniniphilum]
MLEVLSKGVVSMSYLPYQQYDWHREFHDNERFSPVLPFLAGLAVSPFLFGGYGGGYGPSYGPYYGFGYGMQYGPNYGQFYGPQIGPGYGSPYRPY